MPRRPKPANARHPLKQLRPLLSGGPPLNQRELAERLGVATQTIKSIESGQNPLSAPIKETIMVSMGAAWDPTTEKWIFAFAPPGRKIPFTFDLYKEFRKALERPQRDKASVAAVQAKKLELLLKNMPAKDWYQALFSVERALAGWLDQFKVQGKVPADVAGAPEMEIGDFFRIARTAFQVAFDADTGQLQKLHEIPGSLADLPEMAAHAKVDPGAEQKKPAPSRRRKTAA